MRASHIYAPPMAVIMTAGLLLLMYSLINTEFEMPVVTDKPTIESVVMNEPDIGIIYPDPPVRPAPPAAQPAQIVEPVPQVETTSVVNINIHAPTLDPSNPSVSGQSGGELMAIIKVAPQYPRIALSRGLEGFVTVSYTVTETGRTKNVVVLEAVTKEGNATSVFDRAAIAAAEQFKYQPKIQNGQPVAVYGVQNRFVFELEQ